MQISSIVSNRYSYERDDRSRINIDANCETQLFLSFLFSLSFRDQDLLRGVLSKKKECTSDENAQPAAEYRNACSNSSESVQQAGEVGGPPSSSYFSFAPWKRSFDCVNGIRNKSWRRGYVRSTYVVIMSSTTGGIFSNCRQMDTELLEGRRGTLRLQIVFPGESFWESLSCSCLE